MLALADCAVTVSNAQQASRWWMENVGFVSMTVGGTGHAVMIAPPGDKFVVHLCEGFAPVEPGNTGIAFVTDEIDSLVARMRQNGVVFPEPLHREPWGAMAKFADPDGNIFWLLGVPTSMVRRTLRDRAPVGRRVARTRPRSSLSRRSVSRRPGRR